MMHKRDKASIRGASFGTIRLFFEQFLGFRENFPTSRSIREKYSRKRRWLRGDVGPSMSSWRRKEEEEREKRRDVWIKEGENCGKTISPCRKASFYKSRVSLRKIKISRAIQRQASGPCIKGVLTGVSCVEGGKKAETGKERRQRATKEEEHKRERERERDEKSLPRGKLFVDAFPSSRLPSSLVNHDTSLCGKIGKVKINS